MLTGEVPDAVTLDQAVTIARQFGPDIINSVSVTSPQQVLLEVRFIEIARNAGRDLGVQWNRFGDHSIANIGSRQPASNLPITSPSSGTNIPVGEVAAGVLSGGSPFGFMLGRIISNGVTTDVMINALEQKGVARSLAEPNLVALSGDTASFLAGGEYPIPVSGNYGQVTVDYKKYGVGLAFTPTVLNHGVINMKIVPEVSQIDTTHQVAVSANISVPALIVRRASTTVELRDGQSFIIGGLLQTDNHNQIEQVPWVGSVPVLGALFSSKSYQKNQTDLAIIVTPHIVRPAAAGRRNQDAVRRHAATERCRLLPDRQDGSVARQGEKDDADGRALCRRRTAATVHRAHARHAEGSPPMRPSNNLLRGLALTGTLLLLAACSEYFDRRDAISFNAGDAIAADKVTMMVDPWPRVSADKNIRFNGERMQRAVARYRENKVIDPKGAGTSDAFKAQQGSKAADESAAPKPVGPTVTQ